MSDVNIKQRIYAEQFYPFLDSAADRWRGRRIIPYSRCYADAYAVFTSTRDKAIADRERRLQLYVAVGTLVGTGLCGLGPVAGMLAASNKGLISSVANLARAMDRIGLAGRVSAWKVMSTFTFKMLPAGAQGWWSERGKELFTKSLATFQGTVHPGISQNALTPVRSGTPREKLPLEYHLELEGLVLKAKNAVTDFFEQMITDGKISAKEFEQWCLHCVKANFIAKAPQNEVSLASLEKMANEMELALWTMAALSWKWRGTERNSVWTGEGVREVWKYSDFLEEDGVLKRVDTVSKALGIKDYGYALYEFSRNKEGATVLRSNASGVVKQSWAKHFGAWHSDEEKDRFCGWAFAYVCQKADLATIPSEFQGLSTGITSK